MTLRRARRPLDVFRETDEATICQDILNALEAEFGPMDLPAPPGADFFHESLSSDYEIDHAAEAAERVRVVAIEGREKRKIEAERERRHAREEAEYRRKKVEEELAWKCRHFRRKAHRWLCRSANGKQIPSHFVRSAWRPLRRAWFTKEEAVNAKQEEEAARMFAKQEEAKAHAFLRRMMSEAMVSRAEKAENGSPCPCGGGLPFEACHGHDNR